MVCPFMATTFSECMFHGGNSLFVNFVALTLTRIRPSLAHLIQSVTSKPSVGMPILKMSEFREQINRETMEILNHAMIATVTQVNTSKSGVPVDLNLDAFLPMIVTENFLASAHLSDPITKFREKNMEHAISTFYSVDDHVDSTHFLTRRVYSARFSVKSTPASLFAGESGFGPTNSA